MSSPTDSDRGLTPEEEEQILLAEIRKARAAQFADLYISFHKGYLDKCNVTTKHVGVTLRSLRRLREDR